MHYATLACLGPQAMTFLQGQLTCDMRQITSDKLSPGAYCNLKGRVVAFFYLYAVPEGFHLILPADMAGPFCQALKKVIVFSKASLEDISESLPALGVLEAPQFEIAPGLGFTLGNASPAAEDAWEAALIQSKIPTISQAQSGLFLPHDLGLVDLGAVSFEKGCFLGQEIIARMHYKAQLKKHLKTWVGQGFCPLEGEIVNQVVYEGATYILIIAPR